MSSLMRNGEFRRLFLAGILSYFVRWFETLFVAIYIFDLTHSPFVTAAVTMMRFLPLALASLAFGLLADSSSRRGLYLKITLISVTSSALLSSLAALEMLQVWHLFVGAFLSGIHWAMDLPVRRSLLGNSVEQAEVNRAMAFDTAFGNGMRMLGPLFGGVAITLIGIPVGFLVGAIFYALSYILVSGCREEPFTSRPGGGLLRGIRSDLKVMGSNRNLVTIFLITVVFNVFAFPAISMVPVIGATKLQLSHALIGVLAGAEGFGSLIGSLLIGGLIRNSNWYPATYVLGAVIPLVMAIAFASSSNFGVAVLSLFLFGLGLSGFTVMQATLSYVLADKESRGRFLGLISFGIGTAPIGLLLIGIVSEEFGAPNGIRLMSVLGLLCMGLLGAEWRRNARNV